MDDRLLFSQDPADLDLESVRAWYKSTFAGTYRSIWPVLRAAAASSHLKAAEAFSTVAHSWFSALEKGRTPAEAVVVLELNYDLHVLGAVLAATLMPSFALESFVRYCAEVELRLESAGPNVLPLSVSGFENLSFIDRVAAAVQMSNAPPISTDLRRRIEALISFRNATVHDVPVFQAETGHLVHARRGRVSVLQEETLFEGLYPLLSEEKMPLSLAHARLAVDTHDALVAHVEVHASRDFLDAFASWLSPAYEGIAPIKKHGGEMWRHAEEMALQWDSAILPAARAVPLADIQNFLLGATRSERVKAVETDK